MAAVQVESALQNYRQHNLTYAEALWMLWRTHGLKRRQVRAKTTYYWDDYRVRKRLGLPDQETDDTKDINVTYDDARGSLPTELLKGISQAKRWSMITMLLWMAFVVAFSLQAFALGLVLILISMAYDIYNITRIRIAVLYMGIRNLSFRVGTMRGRTIVGMNATAVVMTGFVFKLAIVVLYILNLFLPVWR